MASAGSRREYEPEARGSGATRRVGAADAGRKRSHSPPEGGHYRCVDDVRLKPDAATRSVAIGTSNDGARVRTKLKPAPDRRGWRAQSAGESTNRKRAVPARRAASERPTPDGNDRRVRLKADTTEDSCARRRTLPKRGLR